MKKVIQMKNKRKNMKNKNYIPKSKYSRVRKLQVIKCKAAHRKYKYLIRTVPNKKIKV